MSFLYPSLPPSLQIRRRLRQSDTEHLQTEAHAALFPWQPYIGLCLCKLLTNASSVHVRTHTHTQLQRQRKAPPHTSSPSSLSGCSVRAGFYLEACLWSRLHDDHGLQGCTSPDLPSRASWSWSWLTFPRCQHECCSPASPGRVPAGRSRSPVEAGRARVCARGANEAKVSLH